MKKNSLHNFGILLAGMLIFIIIFLSFLSFFGVLKWSNTSQYALTAVVSKIDTENDAVVCYDAAGNSWVFHGIEDWEVGDVCSMLMNDKGTTEIYDDEIVSVRYGGHVLGLII